MKNRIGFGPRLGAWALDLVFTIGLAYIAATLWADFFEGLVNFDKFNEDQLNVFSSKPALWTWSIIVPIATVIIGFVYNLTEAFLGQTPGKMLLKLQVANQDGTKASMEKYMARFAIKNANAIIGLIGLAVTISAVDIIGQVIGVIIFIGCFLVLGEGKLALHDMIAKTAIYKKDNSTELSE